MRSLTLTTTVATLCVLCACAGDRRPRPSPLPERGVVAHRRPRPSTLPERGVVAHRGASATHPENTIAALDEAIRLGAHQIEVDVRSTADEQLILMHDRTLDRTTDGTGAVSKHGLGQILALDAGSWKSERFRGERVPTLKEALHAVPRDIWLNLHVKGDTGVASAVARLVVEEGRQDHVILSVKKRAARRIRAFHRNLWVNAMSREWERGIYIDKTIASSADFIQFTSKRGIPSRADIDEVHGAGLRVNYCCASDPKRLTELFSIGVDFPMLDDVGAGLEEAGRLGILPTRNRADVETDVVD